MTGFFQNIMQKYLDASMSNTGVFDAYGIVENGILVCPEGREEVCMRGSVVEPRTHPALRQ